jgi:diguanylate cyclase
MPPTSHSTIAWRRVFGKSGGAPPVLVARALWPVVAALAGLELLHDIGVIRGGRALFEDWIHEVVLVGAAVLCLAHATEAGRNRSACLAIGAGLACWAAGDVWWTLLYERDGDPPVPSVADALWLAWYPVTALGFALLIRRGVASFHLHRWMDGIAVMLIVLTPCVALFLAPAAEESGRGTLATIVVLSYPVLDALVIGGVLGVYGLLNWHLDRAWLLLGLGCVLMATGDGLFAAQPARASAVGDNYDFTWSIGALLIALAISRAVDVPTTTSESLGWRAIVLPLAAQAIAAATQVYGLFHEFGPTERLVTLFVLLVAMVQIVVSRPRAPTRED